MQSCFLVSDIPLSVVYSFPVRTLGFTHDDMGGKHVYLCVYDAHFIPL